MAKQGDTMKKLVKVGSGNYSPEIWCLLKYTDGCGQGGGLGTANDVTDKWGNVWLCRPTDHELGTLCRSPYNTSGIGATPSDAIKDYIHWVLEKSTWDD
jgi:hypothetical protein